VHVTVTVPPGSVNFTAFESRLSSTCRAFSASARTASPRSAQALA
jgi:hypothetical protein